MKKSKEESKIVDFFGYGIYADSRQYICIGPKITTYHKTLAHCFEEIRGIEMRMSAVGSKDLAEVLERLQAFEDNFQKLLAPLKKLEK